MQLGSRGSRTRCLVVWTVASGGLALTGALTGAVLGSAPHGLPDLACTPLDLALTDLAALALLGCAAWLWLVTTVVVIGVLRGGVAGPGPHGVPAGVRRVVLVACGVALVGGLTQGSCRPSRHYSPYLELSMTRLSPFVLIPLLAVGACSKPADKAAAPADTTATPAAAPTRRRPQGRRRL